MSAKKIKPRDMREEDKKRRKEKFQEKNIENEKSNTTNFDVDSFLLETAKKSVGTGKLKPKSSAKSIGLKSFFDMGNDQYLMTSFGKGNSAIREVEIKEDGSHKSLTVEKSFAVKNVKIDESGYPKNVEIGNTEDGRDSIEKKALVDMPRKAEDSLSGVRIKGYRKKVEKFYFEKNFNDNIHIQIAYNIMDIEKILAVHINNIIYTINNVFGFDGSKEDFIGYMSLKNSFNDFEAIGKGIKDIIGDKKKKNIISQYEKFQKIISDEKLFYFSSAFRKCDFYENKATEQDKIKESEIKKAYYLLCVLGETRQMIAHNNESYAFLYGLDNEECSLSYSEALEIISKIYSEKIDELNRLFVESSKNNLEIIFQVLGVNSDDDKYKTLKDYYNLVIRKEIKDSNKFGFSIRKIRELIRALIDEDNRINSVPISDEEKKLEIKLRRKINKVFDFIIYKYYDGNEKGFAITDQLRQCSNEMDKISVYAFAAKDVYENCKEQFSRALDKIKSFDSSKIEDEFFNNFNEKYAPDFDEFKISSDKACNFVKVIYAISLFIDGKEINELITTLINKFENINSFIQIIGEDNLYFKKEYKFFQSKCMDAANQLRTVNNFARMGKPAPEENETMINDAMSLLFAEERPYEELDEKLKRFITNNVIKSDRFAYLIRYSNPKNVKKLAANEAVVKFVINRMPESQINRYCEICGQNIGKGQPIERLIAVITGLANNGLSNSVDSLETENMKACVSLYLTVLYLIAKNLVLVNSRYFMAFHCLERDLDILGGADLCKKYGYETKNEKYAGDYAKCSCILSEIVISENEEIKGGKFKEYLTYTGKNIKYIGTDSDGNKSDIRKKYRNNVAHLNIVSTAHNHIEKIGKVSSYFSIYHYMMQKSLLHPNAKTNVYPEELKKYSNRIDKFGEYCKDFVKALNAPFAYNLPRFKNLSVESLFDMNEVVESEPLSTKQDAYSACLQKEKADLIPEGEILKGKVISVTKFGAFVLLDKYKVSGLIYDKEIKNKLKIGDKVKVKAGEPYDGKLSLLLIKKNELI